MCSNSLDGVRIRTAHIFPIAFVVVILTVTMGCSSKQNTAKTRWWQAFNTRYNVYFNGSQAFIEGSIEKETGNEDNFTEMIPLYIVANKNSKELGKGNFETAVLKAEKSIKLHSIKRKPKWTKKRRKTAKDVEWLNRREYNPVLWKAWLLLGKSQFQMGNFDEAAATFSYMARLYSTQPAINGIARAWLAKSYVELDWLYDAEDVIKKMERDTMHYRAVADWDYTYADYYIHAHQYKEAIPYLRKVIKHEKRRKLRARQWYLMGQLYSAIDDKTMAYKSFRRVTRLNPPYILSFNARIAQTEVLAGQAPKKMLRKLKRMARNDNNADYLDQVYYAIGNIYLAEGDTAQAIGAYEKGNKKATRSGIEKGVLLLRLGDLYWELEKYSDAQRCYGEAIGLLDKDRDDYEQLSQRSKVLDELVPFTDAIHLQDSLQELALMDEKDRNAAIDRVIEALIKKEKEEKKAALEAQAQAQAQQGTTTKKTTSSSSSTKESAVWYFYNPTAVSQGKASFQSQWGTRENADDWQRINKTVVSFDNDEEDEEEEMNDSTMAALANDSTMTAPEGEKNDSAANDPHKREYYLAQIPFTEEQVAASNVIIKDGLFHSGVIFKDKLDNLPLSEKQFIRLTTKFPEYEHNDEAFYHLFLLYSRLGDHRKAATYIDSLKLRYPESQWTLLLSNPYFVENAKFGVHIEDSLYGATYEAFKGDRHREVDANVRLSAERFPLGANRAKFLFIGGLSQLNDGNPDSCVAMLTEVVNKYSQSEVAEMAGMIIKGVQMGRTLYGGKFDLGDVWTRRSMSLEEMDSTLTDTLSAELNTGYIFMIAFQPDSVNANQLLYDLAKYNFSNFIVRNFDIGMDADNGIARMMFTGFLSYEEALQYARQLYSDKAMADKLKGCRRIIISEENLPLLGTRYSYQEYQDFFDNKLAPVEISEELLLTVPTEVVTPRTPERKEEEQPAYSDDEYDIFGGFAPIEQKTAEPQEQDMFDEEAAPVIQTQEPVQEQQDMFDEEAAPVIQTQEPVQQQQDMFDEEAAPVIQTQEPVQQQQDMFDEEAAPVIQTQEPVQQQQDMFDEEAAPVIQTQEPVQQQQDMFDEEAAPVIQTQEPEQQQQDMFDEEAAPVMESQEQQQQDMFDEEAAPVIESQETEQQDTEPTVEEEQPTSSFEDDIFGEGSPEAEEEEEEDLPSIEDYDDLFNEDNLPVEEEEEIDYGFDFDEDFFR